MYSFRKLGQQAISNFFSRPVLVNAKECLRTLSSSSVGKTTETKELPGRKKKSVLRQYVPPSDDLTFFPRLAAVTTAKTTGAGLEQKIKLISFNQTEKNENNENGEKDDAVTLGGDIFDVTLRPDIVHNVVRWQLAKRRQGTHSTKTISEVSGTGKKPWKQKGLGKARHGNLRGPQFRGGGISHGPKPRSHEIGLPKQIRRLGLKVALSAKLAEGKLFVMRNVKPESPKTKDMVIYLKKFFPDYKKILFVDSCDQVNPYLRRSTSNIPNVNTLAYKGINVYSILQHDIIIMALGAVRRIEAKLRTPIKRLPSFPSEVVLHPTVAEELRELDVPSLVGNVLTL